jgi:hypothetical protein
MESTDSGLKQDDVNAVMMSRWRVSPKPPIGPPLYPAEPHFAQTAVLAKAVGDFIKLGKNGIFTLAGE